MNEELLKLYKNLVSVEGQRSPYLANTFMYLAATGGKDTTAKEVIDSVLSPRIRQTIVTPPVFRDYGLATIGDIPLGKIPNAKNQTFFGLDIARELNAHQALIGTTGAGKTSYLFRLILTLVLCSIKVIVFDFKRSFVCLGSRYQNTVVLSTTNLKWNPFYPPEKLKSNLRLWISIVAEIFCNTLSFQIGTKGYMVIQLDKLFQRFKTYEGGPVPNPHHLREYLEKNPEDKGSRLKQYWDSLYLRLCSLCFLLHDMWNCERGITIEDLLSLPLVVISFDGLMPEAEELIGLCLLQSAYYHQLANDIRGNYVETVFIIDEALKFFSEAKERKSLNVPLINDTFRKFREFRLGIVLAGQEASFAHAVKANVFCRLLYRTTEEKDVISMGQSMGLSRQQMEFVPSLGDGVAICRIARVPGPFLVEIPEVAIDTTLGVVSNQIIFQELMSKVRPAKSLDEMGIHVRSKKKKQEKTTASEESLLLTISHLTLVEQVASAQKLHGVVEIYDLCGLNRSKGTKIKDELVKAGYLLEFSLKLKPGRGGKTTILVLTPDRGYSLIARRQPKALGRGGALHQALVKQLASYLESLGYPVFIEKEMGSNKKRIDIVFEKKRSLWFAIEVEMTKNSVPHALTNFNQDIQAGISHVFFIAPTKEIKHMLEDRIKPNISAEEKRHVSFYTFDKFLTFK